MQFIFMIPALCLGFFSLSFFANKFRSEKQKVLKYDLQANCLLTRWPLLFITGPRSFFYFDTYWNIYTSYLAEHGYEVYNLNLPWNNSALRKVRLNEFLNQQSQLGKKFHLFLDTPTLAEISDVLSQSQYTAITSLTQITEEKASPKSFFSLAQFNMPEYFQYVSCLPAKNKVWLLDFSYNLHRFILKKYDKLPELSTLGACPQTALLNGRLILERAQVLAEHDLTSE